MRTMQEQLSSPEVQAIIEEEVAPAIRTIEKTPEKVIEKKQTYIANISEYMTEMVARVRAIRVSSPEVRQIRSKEEQEIVAEILRHLGYKDDLLRNRAAHAYADAIIATLPPEPKMSDIRRVVDGESDLPGLLKIKLAVETDKKSESPTLKFEGRRIQFNGGQAAKRVYEMRTALKKAQEVKVTEIRARGRTTREDLLAEKSGLVFIDVPDEIVPDENSESGKKHLNGGALLVVTNSKVVRPAEFVGGFENIMSQISEAKVFIPVRQLFSKRFSAPDLPPEKYYLCKIFHSILRRGLAPELAARQKPAA
ncbi:MAG: hypothetical protein AAB655_01660, partial [Patescibacteria group bacterium]